MIKLIVTISKGQQITMPSEFRKGLKLKVGSKAEVIKKQNRIIIQPVEGDLDKLFDAARKIMPRHKLTAKQMDEQVEHEFQ